MQLGLNKQLQPHEIKSYKHKIKNQTTVVKQKAVCHTQSAHIYTYSQSIIESLTNNSSPNV